MKGVILGLETENGKVIILGHDDKRYYLQKAEWKSVREPKVGMAVDFMTAGDDSAKEAYYIPTTIENQGVAEFAAKVGESAGQAKKQVDAIAMNAVTNLKEFRKRQGEREKEIVKNFRQRLGKNIGICCLFVLLGVFFLVLHLSSGTQRKLIPASPVTVQTLPVAVQAVPVTSQAVLVALPTLPPEDADILVSSDLTLADLGTLSDFLNSMTGDTVVRIECKKSVSKPDERGNEAIGFSNSGYVISQFVKEPGESSLTRFDFDVDRIGGVFVVNYIYTYNSPSITESNKLADVLNESWGGGIRVTDGWADDILKIHRKK